ncbi:hypothetical protein IQ264_05180 [Phormidium sp. LEGE 05292]|uniref:hypothetical protein n=1 Tax=[Phormidium] sp. LEGE 05292 TaxID=767427 RepID=UPI00187FF758|nr:hypothetical protein [Phormidium sp. LEGE 05292]MBE9224859.1 hypothetical protein [Phormidium sp. LEGE 05292]
MNQLEIPLLIAQAQTSQPVDPLINRSDQHLIYLGVGGIIIMLVLIVGLLSRRVATAIMVALVLSAVLIILLTVA